MEREAEEEELIRWISERNREKNYGKKSRRRRIRHEAEEEEELIRWISERNKEKNYGQRSRRRRIRHEAEEE